nr:GMC family oxidoreductase N-terminal domain-containing protein [uncultured Shinella sp.]
MSTYNYWFKTTPQRHLDNRGIDQPRGRVLGGSSSINGMTFLRGNPRDFDDWHDKGGCGGRPFADCLLYFSASNGWRAPKVRSVHPTACCRSSGRTISAP